MRLRIQRKRKMIKKPSSERGPLRVLIQPLIITENIQFSTKMKSHVKTLRMMTMQKKKGNRRDTKENLND
jgi:hypothetical protein